MKMTHEIVRGQVLVAPGSIHPHRRGEADLVILSKKEGGRHTPFGVGYKPQFFFGPTDVTGEIGSLEGGAVEPGGRARVTFALVRPVAFEAGMRFALREGGRTIGAGIVTAIGS